MAEFPIICALRQRRTEVGLSQSDLAQQIGVSRQALIAIEAGRQVPSTRTALHLARALRCGVEDLFTLPAGPVLHATLAPGPSAPSGRVAVGEVDGAWAAHVIPNSAQPGDGLLVGQIANDRATVDPLADPSELEKNVLVAGCAPLLGVLAGRLGRRYRDARATWVPANSGRAVELLDRGLVHVAGLHLVESDAPGGHSAIVRERFPDHATTIINLTRWRQGLVVAPGNPLSIRGAQDVLRPDVRFARREAGAGAQRLIERLAGGNPTGGPLAAGHDEVARLVRWGVADVGVAIEAAALAEGLEFIPLSEERFDLLVPESRLDTPKVARLLELIEKPFFRSEASRLPGYDLSTSGHSATVGVQ